jgi:hypothetical protein
VLQTDLQAALVSYWKAVCSARKDAPFRVTRAREVMSLMFLWWA